METIEDIVKGMRSTYKTLSKLPCYKHNPLLASWNGYILRIEAAFKWHETEFGRVKADRDIWRRQALEEDAVNQVQKYATTNDLDAEVAKLLTS